jgi:carboxylesterase
VIALVALAAVLATLLAWRYRYVNALVKSSNARRPLAPSGIVKGGDGFVLDRPGAPAVLLLHGAGDTPQTLRYLAVELHRRGFHVSVPLLPGHGRSVSDFRRIRADDIVTAARASYDGLRCEHDWVAVIGLSMGGALAVQIAADSPDLPALGLAAPYLALPPHIDDAAKLSWLWGPLLPVVRSTEGLSVLDPVERARNLAYGLFTPAALRALRTIVRDAVTVLPRVAAPTLVVQSRQDNRISVLDAERAFALLGATEKRLEWVSGASHIVTVDFGHEQVIASLASWMETHRVNR